METESTSVVDQLRQQYNLKVESEVLMDALDGLEEGISFVLSRYGVKQRPLINIGDHDGLITGTSGYVETTTGDKLIVLQVDELRRLEGANINTKLIEHYGKDVPIKPRLTVRQWLEGFAVEETVHWLQGQELKGLENLPSPEHRIRPIFNDSGVAYLLQPHEFQALVVRGDFYIYKYGVNPLQELENFIKSKR